MSHSPNEPNALTSGLDALRCSNELPWLTPSACTANVICWSAFCSLSLCSIAILCGCDGTDKSMGDATIESHASPTSALEMTLAEETDIAPPSTHGEKKFNDFCAACHRRGGQGTQGRVPPLDHSPWVAGSQDRLIRIVLNGLRGPIEIDGQTYNLEMPAFRTLFQDDDIAAILTYVRQQYGSPSPPITTATVNRVREETQNRTGYWTVSELLQVP